MPGYPQISFNPYSMYQNWGYGYQYPAFRGVQNVPQPVSVPQPNVRLQTPPDTVSFKATERIQTKPKKEGLSTGAKWGLGALALAGVGTAIYFATRGRVGGKQAQQLAEHIEFKPAKTVEEAIQFGKTHLGIKDYKGFEAKDIEVVNWLNAGFVKANNKFKGKSVMPKIVDFAEHGDDVLQGVDRFKHSYLVDKGVYGNIDSYVQKQLDNFISKGADGKINIPPADCSQSDLKFLTDKIKQFVNNKNSMKFRDKVELSQNLLEYVDSLTHYKYKPVSEFGTIYHEFTHLLDDNLLTRTRSLASNEKTIARKVSEYATTTRAEYIAEVGRKHLEGISLPDDVMALYKKFGGPVLT